MEERRTVGEGRRRDVPRALCPSMVYTHLPRGLRAPLRSHTHAHFCWPTAARCCQRYALPRLQRHAQPHFCAREHAPAAFIVSSRLQLRALCLRIYVCCQRIPPCCHPHTRGRRVGSNWHLLARITRRARATRGNIACIVTPKVHAATLYDINAIRRAISACACRALVARFLPFLDQHNARISLRQQSGRPPVLFCWQTSSPGASDSSGRTLTTERHSLA